MSRRERIRCLSRAYNSRSTVFVWFKSSVLRDDILRSMIEMKEERRRRRRETTSDMQHAHRWLLTLEIDSFPLTCFLDLLGEFLFAFALQLLQLTLDVIVESSRWYRRVQYQDEEKKTRAKEHFRCTDVKSYLKRNKGQSWQEEKGINDWWDRRKTWEEKIFARRDTVSSQPTVWPSNDELIIIIVIYDALSLSLSFSLARSLFSPLSVSHLVSVLWYHLFLSSLDIHTHIRLIRKSSGEINRVHLHQTQRLLWTRCRLIRWEKELLAKRATLLILFSLAIRAHSSRWNECMPTNRDI